MTPISGDGASSREDKGATNDLERAMTAAEAALATGDAAALGWQLALEQITSLRAGLEELLSVAERMRGGDPSLDPEEWFAARDYARKVLNVFAD